jgi:beta-lactam-binding protein with PASTA domain
VPALFGPEWDRYPNAPNPDFLTAAQAREAVLAAGLVTGSCTLDDSGNGSGRVWKQEPVAGSLVEYGTPVDVWVASDCDVYTGERVILE